MNIFWIAAVAAAALLAKKKSISGIGKLNRKKRIRRISGTEVEPAVYVGTYRKYNNGSLFGEWVTISDFDSYEDFMAYIRKLHADEDDPEFMYQDYEGFPRAWYSESDLSKETFDRIKEYSKLGEEEKDAYDAYCDLFDYSEQSIDDFNSRYYGYFPTYTALAESYIDMAGGVENLGRETLESNFDYESFGRQLSWELVTDGGYYFYSL